ADYCSVYTIPLFTRNGEIFGTISTYFRKSYYPSERKMNIVELYAVQAGWAINNARLYDEAQKANRLKDEFLTTISHELRTPLTSLWGWVQLLSSHKFDENTTTQALKTIENNTKTLVNIVDDILDVSKIIQGKLNLNICVFDLMSIMEIIIKNLTPAAQAKNLKIQLELDEQVNLISGDPERVQQIIWNLVSNSIKFTNGGGEVRVKLSVVTMNHTQYVQIEVIDTGIGIAEDLLPYIFDRFRQADSTIRRNYGGLGLGLALVKHLVELHGGEVFAESQGLGMGAKFVVKLPLLIEN
ncbi:MAG TPA: HAMP domain-containing sensor histidine kinase, partial [Allocoleopsis sp.]